MTTDHTDTDPAGIEDDKFAEMLAEPDPGQTSKTSLIAPSPNPATNMLIVDVLTRGIGMMMRRKLEHRVVAQSTGDEVEAEELVDSKSLLSSLALYGVSRLAVKSPVGLGVVATGLVLKTLYDRGAARKRRRRKLL
ncbi:hypothetical protein [Qipengyuania nanhaisediminis]|uniref:hypothetical protein n=1 Tax=Qipengyuania nanhaisediminis TaxID=604088 RepID=UPI0038B3B17D